MKTCRIVVLSDNTVGRADLLAEHGWSCWIEFGEHRVLFDTGQGGVLLHNAYRLDVDLTEATDIVLSHGHFDHVNGLPDAVRGKKSVRLWMHPAAVESKYSVNASVAPRPIGMSSLARSAIKASRIQIQWVEEPIRIVENLYATGPIPRMTDFESPGGGFYLDKNCESPDPLLDDQSLFFRSREGLVILLGCAHAGVVNTIRHIESIVPGEPIHAVIGGMHLKSASTERISSTIEELRRRKIGILAPAHCTGANAAFHFRQAFDSDCEPCSVGREFIFQLPDESPLTGLT